MHPASMIGFDYKLIRKVIEMNSIGLPSQYFPNIGSYLILVSRKRNKRVAVKHFFPNNFLIK